MPQKLTTEVSRDGATVTNHGKPPDRLDEGAQAPKLTAIKLPTNGRTVANHRKPPNRLD